MVYLSLNLNIIDCRVLYSTVYVNMSTLESCLWHSYKLACGIAARVAGGWQTVNHPRGSLAQLKQKTILCGLAMWDWRPVTHASSHEMFNFAQHCDCLVLSFFSQFFVKEGLGTRVQRRELHERRMSTTGRISEQGNYMWTRVQWHGVRCWEEQMNLVNQGRKLGNAGGECVWELGLPLYMVFTCELFMQSQGCSLSAECLAPFWPNFLYRVQV